VDNSVSAADGKPQNGHPAGADLVRSALADARAMTRAAPRPGRDARRRQANRDANRRANTNRGGYSGAGPDERDPQPLGAVLGRLTSERGWQQELAQARVFAEWSTLVGPEVADHCVPVSLTEGELRLAAESTAWATQLRMLAASLLNRLVAELGPTVVTKLLITGPVAPSWSHGGRSVRGARGPRDTYG
jgi:predicted nucleic acid-binding Zn ribbon protein